jgi:death-on-curing family protein
MKIITTADVEHIAFNLARELLAFDEPIPDYSTRFGHVLESCLLTPFQKFSRKPFYPSLVAKASILLYLLIKNHPFQNGNKRIALTTLLVFLYRNGKWIKVDTQEFYNFTVWVAQSPAELKDEVVMGIERFIKSHLVDLAERSSVENRK